MLPAPVGKITADSIPCSSMTRSQASAASAAVRRIALSCSPSVWNRRESHGWSGCPQSWVRRPSNGGSR